MSNYSFFSTHHQLSKSERKRLVELLRSQFSAGAELLQAATTVEIARLRDIGLELVIIDKVPAIVLSEKITYPTLMAAIKLSLKLPMVVVDMGAVPHILNGADVMAPGIVDHDAFGKNDLVYIADVNQQRVFAVGQALVSSEELENMKKGRVIRNLHYAGDKIWKIISSM
ncbi:MAG: PUA domain-containing protein [Thermofilaceae archaeon]